MRTPENGLEAAVLAFDDGVEKGLRVDVGPRWGNSASVGNAASAGDNISIY